MKKTLKKVRRSRRGKAAKASPSTRFAKRLASYTAAAGLGAFSYGEAANAQIIHVDLGAGISHSENGSYTPLDLDNNGTTDFMFGKFSNAAGGARMIVYGHPASFYPVVDPFFVRFDDPENPADPVPPPLPAEERSINLTNLTNPNTGAITENPYYIRSFVFGDAIDPSLPNVVEPSSVANPVPGQPMYLGIMNGYGANFGNLNDPQYWGFGLNIDGDIHYGWGRISFIPDDGGNRIATLYEYAYQSEPGVPIAAGQIPEPNTLALLAAGGGGLALLGRRRRK